MKQCCTCKEAKELSEFYRVWNNQRNKHYYRSLCKKCDKAQALQWHFDNHERSKKKSRQWHEANKELANAKRKEAYRAEDSEVRQAKRKEYYEANKAMYVYNSAKRKRHVKRATPEWADQECIKARYVLSKYLTELDGRQRHVDHIIPLRGELVSGLHVHDNLQILLAEDNLSKSNNYEVL